MDLLAAVAPQVCVFTRLRLDAALYEPAAPRRANKVGRPRRKGVRLPTLQTVLANPRTDLASFSRTAVHATKSDSSAWTGVQYPAAE